MTKNNIIIYTKNTCPFCVAAKNLLNNKTVEFQEVNIEGNVELLQEMIHKGNGHRTVPSIFINGKHIGGYDSLKSLEESGELDKLLNQ